MHRQVAWALAHPVFDPERQITGGHFWQAGSRISADFPSARRRCSGGARLCGAT